MKKLESAEQSLSHAVELYDSILTGKMNVEEASRIGSLSVMSPVQLDLDIFNVDMAVSCLNTLL